MKIICPICKEETIWEENPYRPFCSDRCKLIDLGAWASEKYRIEGEDIKGKGENGDTGDNERDNSGGEAGI